jgi:hypothetical protein
VDVYNPNILIYVAGPAQNESIRKSRGMVFITMARIPVGVKSDQLASFSYLKIPFNILPGAVSIA